MMSGGIPTTDQGYSLTDLAQLMGIDEGEAATILEEHGYRVPAGDDRLTLSEEDYLDLMEAAPIEPDGSGD